MKRYAIKRSTDDNHKVLSILNYDEQKREFTIDIPEDVTAVDCSGSAIAYAIKKAQEEGLPITHLLQNSNHLSELGDAAFDVVLCAMMLMDVEDLQGTLQEVFRVLRPGGSVLLSLLHPCFKPPAWHRWFQEEDGIQVRVKDYFSPAEWEGQINGVEGKVIYRHKTLSEYVKAFVQAGFVITDMNEPLPTSEQIEKSSRIEWLTHIPMYLFVTLTKP